MNRMRTAVVQSRNTAARTPPTMAPTLTGFDVVDWFNVVDMAVVAVEEAWGLPVGKEEVENDVVEG